MENNELMRQGIPSKQVILSDADLQNEIQNAKRVGQVETISTLIRLSKTGLLSFGAYALTSKFSSNKTIALAVAAIVGVIDFFRIGTNIAGVQRLINQSKHFAKEATQAVNTQTNNEKE